MKNFLELPALNLDGSRMQVDGTDAVVQCLGLGELHPDRMSVEAVRLGTANGQAKDGMRDTKPARIRLNAANPAHKAVIDGIAAALLAAYPTLGNALACPYPQEMADCQMQIDYILGTGGTPSDALDWLEKYANAPVARKAAKVKIADAALFQARKDAADADLLVKQDAKQEADDALAAAIAADPQVPAAITAAQDAVAAASAAVAAAQKVVAWRSALVAL